MAGSSVTSSWVLGNVKVGILPEPIWASAASHDKGFRVSGLDLGSNAISSIFAVVESSSFSLSERR